MKTFLTLLVMMLAIFATAQLKTTTACSAIYVDVLDGKVNGALPKYTPSQVKGLLPCFTEDIEETPDAKCGGGVFYSDKDIYFYTGRDYIEIREKFNGKLSIPIMGAARNSLFKWLGHPKVKDVNWDVYSTAYGLLIVSFNKTGKINKFRMTTKSMDEINLCE